MKVLLPFFFWADSLAAAFALHGRLDEKKKWMWNNPQFIRDKCCYFDICTGGNRTGAVRPQLKQKVNWLWRHRQFNGVAGHYFSTLWVPKLKFRAPNIQKIKLPTRKYGYLQRTAPSNYAKNLMNVLKITLCTLLALNDFCIWFKIFWKNPGGWKGASALSKCFHGRGTRRTGQVLGPSSLYAGTCHPQQLNDGSWLSRSSPGIRARGSWGQDERRDTDVSCPAVVLWTETRAWASPASDSDFWQ